MQIHYYINTQTTLTDKVITDKQGLNLKAIYTVKKAFKMSKKCKNKHLIYIKKKLQKKFTK